MGEMVEFAANGSTARGYVAAATGGSGPGVIVLQEWWGLVPQIKGVCDLLAERASRRWPPTCIRARWPPIPRWTRLAS